MTLSLEDKLELHQLAARYGDKVQLFSGIFPIDSQEKGAGHRVFYGSYYDQAVKTAAGWRISRRVFSTRRL